MGDPRPITPSSSASLPIFSMTSLIPSLSASKSRQSATPSPSVSGGSAIVIVEVSGIILATIPIIVTTGMPPSPSSIRPSLLVSRLP